jgi:phage protein D
MPAKSQEHVASIGIKVSGAQIPPELARVLLEVKVKESVAVPSSALLRFNDPGLQQVDKPVFDIGKEIEITMGGLADRSGQTIFKGEIVAYEPEFTKGGCVISLRAYDKSHRLQRSSKVRTFQDVTATDIVKKITQEAGLSGTADPTQANYKFFIQSGETDRELIRRFERDYNFQFFIENGRYKFRPATNAGASIATLKYGEGLMAFRPRISSAQQVKEVEVRGWDPVQKQGITSSATNSATNSMPGLDRGKVERAYAGNKVLVADRVIDSTTEAQKLAKASIDGRAEAYVEAEGQCLGNPKLHAGKKVKIEGVGNKLSGEYVLTSVTHWYRGEKGYYTNFEISGRSARGLLDLVHPPQ